MKNIVVGEGIILTKLKKWVSSSSTFYIAKAKINGKKINITYFSEDNNVIIHEWYLLGSETSANVRRTLTDFFCEYAKEPHPTAAAL